MVIITMASLEELLEASFLRWLGLGFVCLPLSLMINKIVEVLDGFSF